MKEIEEYKKEKDGLDVSLDVSRYAAEGVAGHQRPRPDVTPAGAEGLRRARAQSI